MAALNIQADLHERLDHLITQIRVVVDRRYREVAALVARLVAQVAAFLLSAGVPCPFDGIQEVVAGVLASLKPHVIKNVELRFGTEIHGVGDARRCEVGLCLGGDSSGVATVGLVGEGVQDGVIDHQGLRRTEGIDECAGDIGHELHIRLMDGLEPTNRRAVEHQAIREGTHVRRCGHVEVLHHSGKVDEANINKLDVLILHELQGLVGIAKHDTSCAVTRDIDRLGAETWIGRPPNGGCRRWNAMQAGFLDRVPRVSPVLRPVREARAGPEKPRSRIRPSVVAWPQIP